MAEVLMEWIANKHLGLREREWGDDESASGEGNGHEKERKGALIDPLECLAETSGGETASGEAIY
jgi:hypothetical protein